MKIEHNNKPPIYDRAVKEFGVDWDDGVIFAYDDTIYCKYDIEAHKLLHEATHLKQQSLMGADNWWAKYFMEKEFRLEQEVEAYREENKLLRTLKDRELKAQILHENAVSLSSSMYGNIVTYEEARKLLKI